MGVCINCQAVEKDVISHPESHDLPHFSPMWKCGTKHATIMAWHSISNCLGCQNQREVIDFVGCDGPCTPKAFTDH